MSMAGGVAEGSGSRIMGASEAAATLVIPAEFREFHGTHIYMEWRRERDKRVAAENELKTFLDTYSPEQFETQKARLALVERALASEQERSRELSASVTAMEAALKKEANERCREEEARLELEDELARMGKAYRAAAVEADALRKGTLTLEKRLLDFAKEQRENKIDPKDMEALEARIRDLNREVAVSETQKDTALSQVANLESAIAELRGELTASQTLAQKFAAQYEQGELAMLMLRTGYTKHGGETKEVLRMRLGVLEREHSLLKEKCERLAKEANALRGIMDKHGGPGAFTAAPSSPTSPLRDAHGAGFPRVPSTTAPRGRGAGNGSPQRSPEHLYRVPSSHSQSNHTHQRVADASPAGSVDSPAGSDPFTQQGPPLEDAPPQSAHATSSAIVPQLSRVSRAESEAFLTMTDAHAMGSTVYTAQLDNTSRSAADNATLLSTTLKSRDRMTLSRGPRDSHSDPAHAHASQQQGRTATFAPVQHAEAQEPDLYGSWTMSPPSGAAGAGGGAGGVSRGAPANTNSGGAPGGAGQRSRAGSQLASAVDLDTIATRMVPPPTMRGRESFVAGASSSAPATLGPQQGPDVGAVDPPRRAPPQTHAPGVAMELLMRRARLLDEEESNIRGGKVHGTPRTLGVQQLQGTIAMRSRQPAPGTF